MAYAFAAFAKLNSDFFDPAVSCAVYYQDQLVTSWGLPMLSVDGQPGLALAVALAAAVTELAVAAFLMFRRTRRAGLLLALSFHWLLALDWSQHFWDFSAVLFAGFVLFADDAALEKAREFCVRPMSRVPRPVWLTLGGMALLAYAIVAVAAALPGDVYRGLAVLAGHATWVVWGTAVVALVVVSVLRTKFAR